MKLFLAAALVAMIGCTGPTQRGACTVTLTQVGPSGQAVWVHASYSGVGCGTAPPAWSSPTACVTPAYCINEQRKGSSGCDPGGACGFDALVTGELGRHDVYAQAPQGGQPGHVTVTLTQE